MSISRDDVRAIARLARLRLSEAEVERFTPQLNDILRHVATLARVGRADEAPAAVGPRGSAGQESHAGSGEPPPMGEATALLADDVVGPDPLACPPSAFAPGFRAGLFTLPRVDALAGEGLDEPLAAGEQPPEGAARGAPPGGAGEAS